MDDFTSPTIAGSLSEFYEKRGAPAAPLLLSPAPGRKGDWLTIKRHGDGCTMRMLGIFLNIMMECGKKLRRRGYFADFLHPKDFHCVRHPNILEERSSRPASSNIIYQHSKVTLRPRDSLDKMRGSEKCRDGGISPTQLKTHQTWWKFTCLPVSRKREEFVVSKAHPTLLDFIPPCSASHRSSSSLPSCLLTVAPDGRCLTTLTITRCLSSLGLSFLSSLRASLALSFPSTLRASLLLLSPSPPLSLPLSPSSPLSHSLSVSSAHSISISCTQIFLTNSVTISRPPDFPSSISSCALSSPPFSFSVFPFIGSRDYDAS
ncbi:hypothetical protein EJ110_NYTH36001 [Nymphaea thermarum]|nr:hypothetical protein EJ110_NYTH36001 [Nymphaea thermarum]